GCFLHAAECLCRDRPARSRGSSGSQATQQKRRIGQIKAETLRRRLAPGDERSQPLSAGGSFPSNPLKRQNRSGRPPHEVAAFRMRLPHRCATAGGTVGTATSAYFGPTTICPTANVTN